LLVDRDPSPWAGPKAPAENVPCAAFGPILG